MTKPRSFVTPLLAALVLSHVSVARAASVVHISEGKDGAYNVTIAGQPFTTVHTKGFAKPILYPVVGPGDVPMTRNFPMKKDVPGEAADHPHHQSLWFTHGDVNGVSFWDLNANHGNIVTTKVTDVDDRGTWATMTLHNRWEAADGKPVMTDTTVLRFHKLGNDERAIDWIVTIHATEGEVVFGDTKEGSAGIRTNPALRIDKGAAAVNSEGVEGKAIWGKRAKWVDYSATVDGKPVGVAIFDHPSNPRHPTWWHAREYGLVAANAFGVSSFEKQPKGAGNFKIDKGSSVTFHWRFVFHNGDVKTGKVAEKYAEFATEK